MNRNIVIIKLGGAAITIKDQEYTPDLEVISRVFNEIKESGCVAIIVHGAGSYAHPIARKYNLRNGRDEKVTLSDQRSAISRIRMSVTKLHLLLLEAADQAGLNTFSVPISAIMVSNGPELETSAYYEVIHEALSQEFVPIIFGDMVFDTENQFRVVSGDRIIRLLTKFLQVKGYSDIEVIFGTNVDGLYDRDPKYSDAKFYSKMTKSQLDEIKNQIGESLTSDITGGMKGKITEIIQILDLEVNVKIINLMKPDFLLNLLTNKPTIHSEFTS
ncbi:MAG: hypothetical protein IH840_11380 [Candidatus Heimdallarchaeota archaeon]|nr:hypothetical protein [Candidatus Heimdallarchaeota archaeon]